MVCGGGRPVIANGALDAVRAPALLTVGGHDSVVLELNQRAAGMFGCLHEVVVVPGATHLFEEPGALDQVARLAGDWFATHLPSGHFAAGATARQQARR